MFLTGDAADLLHACQLVHTHWQLVWQQIAIIGWNAMETAAELNAQHPRMPASPPPSTAPPASRQQHLRVRAAGSDVVRGQAALHVHVFVEYAFDVTAGTPRSTAADTGKKGSPSAASSGKGRGFSDGSVRDSGCSGGRSCRLRCRYSGIRQLHSFLSRCKALRDGPIGLLERPPPAYHLSDMVYDSSNRELRAVQLAAWLESTLGLVASSGRTAAELVLCSDRATAGLGIDLETARLLARSLAAHSSPASAGVQRPAVLACSLARSPPGTSAAVQLESETVAVASSCGGTAQQLDVGALYALVEERGLRQRPEAAGLVRLLGSWDALMRWAQPFVFVHARLYLLALCKLCALVREGLSAAINGADGQAGAADGAGGAARGGGGGHASMQRVPAGRGG